MPLDFRYRRLGCVALKVSDLACASDFYRDMVGLAVAGEGCNGERMLRCTGRHHDVALPGLHSIDFWGAVPEPGFAAQGKIERLAEQ